ncbi:MAG: lipoate--protein ligase family protein [Pseudomonadota bacterium]
MIKADKEKSWRFIDTGINNGFMNMAIDEAMLEMHLQEQIPPTLRIYRWSPPALSIGCSQRMEDDVDRNKCLELGIDVVRRLTGGRGVLHNNELTYTVIASGKYGLPGTILESYRILNEGLIAAYRILGLEVNLVSNDKVLPSAACFAGTATADLTCRGKKIAGGAQFRRGEALLQHGSLPIVLDTELSIAVHKFSSPEVRSRALSTLRTKATDIKTALGKQIDWQELADAIFEGFQKSMGIKLYKDKLTSAEIKLGRKLAKEKYSTDDWNDFGMYNDGKR